LVRRGKWVIFKLLRLHPAKIRCPNQLGLLAGRNRGTIDNQVDMISIVAVRSAGSGVPYVDIDGYAGE
jgi:hypothetical protein